jgi:chemotaxis protein MotB
MRTLISLQSDSDRDETPNIHRWMVSYADFISLLFILFLVLYTKLPKKPEVIAQEVRPPQAETAKQTPPMQAQENVNPTPVQKDQKPQEKQRVLFRRLADSLSDLMAAGDITLVTREEGVLLEIRDTALFASGTAEPAERARDIFVKVAEIIGKGDNLVVVEGHTDNVPIQTAQYPSNWELSSARAGAVVRALQEHGISPSRLTASGLAETKPKSSNETAQGRRENRRVSVLVLNGSRSEEWEPPL